MKFYINLITCIYISIAILISSANTGLSSYLKIDLVEAVNLHCKLNNEFYCNPYTIFEFKYSSETKTSRSVECTKHPKWESSYTFTPELCKDLLYINFYQYLTPRDNSYLDTAQNEDENVEKGDYKPGYLGRVILELEKIPHGLIDDWFMIDSPSENTRVVFPSCVHLRLYWTSSECSEPSDSTRYQIKPATKEEFLPKNYIPMCKKDFAMIYRTKFSRIESEDQIKKGNDLAKDISSACKMDVNTDYGFLHKYSNLTSIEEALVYKIIKRTTGEIINYEEFTSEYSDPNKNNKYIKSYKEFFEKDCFQKPEMTIERVNYILKNDAESFPQNTTNYFITPDVDKLDYTEKMNLNLLQGVYKDTLNQFYAIEDIKGLKTMDDDSYKQTLNKLTNVIKSLHAYKKIDETIFDTKNKVLLTNEGLINPKEEYFFRIYALYKWNGGQYPYDEMKREFMLRRKYFDCYERVDMMPTNIIFQFVDDVCPNNYVCVDPNGIVINSVGRNPNEVFSREIQETKLKFLEKAKYKIKSFRTALKENNPANASVKNSKNLRFRENNLISQLENSKNSKNSQIESKIENSKNVKNDKNSSSESESTGDSNKETYSESEDKLNFEDLLKMETTSLDPQSLENQETAESAKVSSFVKKDEENKTKTHNLSPYINTITYKNKFDIFYEQRLIRIKKKKEVIINKVFNHIPLLGEVLSLANLEADNKYKNSIEHVDQKFLDREIDLFKKYLLLYDANIPFVEKSAKVLLDLILCNNDKTSIAYVLRELLEGLCYGDDRSIKIFEEIVRTVLIEALIIKPYYHFADLNAKVNLLNTLNKPLCYKAITKIRFLEMMLMYDFLKEKITFIIYNNSSNKIIAERIKDTETAIPETLPKSMRRFSYQIGNEFDDSKKVLKTYLAEMDKIKIDFEESKKRKKYEEENNINNGKFRFKSVNENDDEDDDLMNRIKTIKSIINDDTTKKRYNITLFERDEEENEMKRVGDLKKENRNKFITNDFVYGNNTKNDNNNSSIKINQDDLMNEFKDFELIHQQDINEKFNKEEQNNIKNEIDKSSRKENDDVFQSSNKQNLFEKSKDTFPKFKSLNSNSKKQFSLDPSEDSEEFVNQSLNNYNNPHIYDNQQDKGYSILSTNQQPTSQDVLDRVMKDPKSRKIIEDVKNNPENGKIILPKEIHTVYEVEKKGTKQVTVNEDNPTKKMILNNLMDENSFNDLVYQEEKKEEDNDQTGLYNVLKNIQNRKCSQEFLCIEIGNIYGPFDNLKPKNVTIMTKHKENVHVIIKPIILINNTLTGKEDKKEPPQADIFSNDDDCDILKISNEKDMSPYNSNMRFKQLVDRDAKQSKLKRKFYRKVEIGNEILATEIFKQGLNLIILKRENKYPKIFERTYNTNSDPIESDAMACVLRDAGYDKIIIITGIGKWMGAITPRLIKEIKQIGGPNLNYLVSPDGEDNSMADHAFILIGRRGLCRYNGVFRVKNYDVSTDMKKYFPDLSSDPNDCYFDDIKFDNEKNKNSENKFFHLIDLRLTLDLCNDSRFSTNAPVITNVFPSSGPLNGGQSVKIRGINFGAKTLDIKEVLVRGVICKNVVLESPFLITCVTGSSTIMGPGIGNIQVKLLCGLSSPQATCSMYQYTSEVVERGYMGASVLTVDEINPDSANTSDSITILHKQLPHPIPIFPNPIPGPPLPPFPAPLVSPVIHTTEPIVPVPPHFPHSIFARRPSLFSFKEKQTNQDDKKHPDDNTKMILERLNSKEYLIANGNKEHVEKIDNLVTDNYKHILSQINSNNFLTPRDGFRKRRFKNIFEKLK